MKGIVLSVVVGSVLATANVAAQSTPAQEVPKPTEVTVTGCVIQGSAPTVFILDNARLDPQDRNEKSRTYVLLASTEDLRLRTHLNHEVRVTGLAEVKAVPVPPPGQKVAEKDLPKFTAKTITMVADRCTAIAAK
jgi:hypothetical protein